MDGHYEQTMAARARAVNDPRRSWFAFGTALDRAALEDWRSQHGYAFFELPPGQLAEAVDVTLAFDFPSRFWGGRVAGLTAAPGRRVYGVVYDIPGVDWPVVRHKEGALTGMCEELPVQLADGTSAIAFTTRAARRSTEGPVSAGFVEAMQRGAAAAGLPPAWLEEIARAAAG
jgi:gamma-glutamylcyclotransferase